MAELVIASLLGAAEWCYPLAMQLKSQVQPPYAPEPKQHTVQRLGLQPLPPAQWLLVDADFAQFHAHKQFAVRAHRDKCLVALPGSEAAQRELHGALLANLRDHHGDAFSRTGDSLTHLPTGLDWDCSEFGLAHYHDCVQEDLCLLQERDERLILTAASVCSPSNWRLEEKIGRDLDVIHGPVPGYQTELATRVNRLLRRLKPNKPVQRYNWSIQPGNELLWREDICPPPAGAEPHWRVERQTLLRLPKTGAIVFGIRIFLHGLAELRRDPHWAATLDTVLARLPAAERHYKGLSDQS